MTAHEAAARSLDLAINPLSLPGSRLYLRLDATGLAVHSAEYEREPEATVLLSEIEVADSAGRALSVTELRPESVELGGEVTITFAGPRGISIGGGESAWTLRARLGPSARQGEGELPWAGRWLLGGVDGDLTLTDDGVTFTSRGGQDAQFVLGTAGAVPSTGHRDALDGSREVWAQWMARCPRVRPDLAEMAAHCWWVLGNNTIDLLGHTGHAVVPDLVGYAGLWQWDAYFIAAGLRHGAPDLAREQVDIALRYPTANGQLPDVVHDGGVLASSEDLPPADLEHLRLAGSAVADPDAHIPLTKPPLTAWAINTVADPADPAWRDRAMERALASQRWWFSDCDSDGDGMPEYSHPYSSGLDDSPIFDGELPVTSPDLGAYLVLQDELLAAWATEHGDRALATECTQRAQRTWDALAGLWDGLRFAPRTPHGPIAARTIVELMPLLATRCPADMVAVMASDLADPGLFEAPYGVPTVARSDPAFAPDVMWRGPAWVNMNTMAVVGLRNHGFHEQARALAEKTLGAVMQSGHAYEYLNPLTGRPGKRAVTAFGWTAALFIDLAVAVSP